MHEPSTIGHCHTYGIPLTKVRHPSVNCCMLVNQSCDGNTKITKQMNNQSNEWYCWDRSEEVMHIDDMI